MQKKEISFENISHFTMILLYLLSFEIFSDKLKLTNGEIRIGKAVSVGVSHVEWQEQGKNRKIPLTDVAGVEVGYDGVPVCVEYSNQPTINCDLILHQLTSSMASLTSEASPLKLDVVPLNKIQFLKLTFTKSVNYDLFLKPGVNGFWETVSFKGVGTLRSIKNQTWEILPTGKNQTAVNLLNTEIIAFEYTRKPKITEIILDNSPLIVPGLAQVREKKYGKAFLLFGGALLSGSGMIYEYNQSVAAINKSQEFIPTPDGQVIIVSNLLSTNQYEFHKERFQIYTILFASVIAYSLFDSFYLGHIETKSGTGLPLWFKPNIRQTPVLTSKLEQNHSPGDYFQYGFEFETRF